jgi:dolichyl-phosphate-mannose-protein mannosyltransferase
MINQHYRQSASTSTLFLVLGIGLALRLLLAYALLPNSGLISDLNLYADWAITMANVGPSDFYAKIGFSDYPPGYLYVLWLIGEIGKVIAFSTNVDVVTATTSLLKLPPILLDVCAAFMLYHIVRNWSADHSNDGRRALFASAIYLFNPVTWYDSAIWGQTDAAGACLMLLGFIALIRWPSEAAAAIAVLASLVKPQFGVVLVPIICIVLVKRHLITHRTSPTSASTGPKSLFANNGPVRLLSSAIVATALFYSLAAPFGLGFHSFLARMSDTAQGYPILSVNAYNPWALIGSGDTAPLAFYSSNVLGFPATWSRDDIALFGPITGVMIGTTLLILGFLIGTVRLLWRADRWSIALVGAYLSMCFFMLPTRVHERYLFSAFAFMPLLAALDRKWLWATGILALGSFINLHGILTIKVHGSPNILSLPFAEFCHSTAGVIVSITLSTAAFCFALWALLPREARGKNSWHKTGEPAQWTAEPPNSSRIAARE